MRAIRPLTGEVLIEMDPDEGATAGGIVIPEMAQEKAHTGTVRRIGSWKKNKAGMMIQPPVRVGDHVVIGKHAGRQLYNDSRFKLVQSDRILAVLSESE